MCGFSCQICINGLFSGWAKLFQTKCHSCQFPIEPGDRWVEALNQNWHSECFNCSVNKTENLAFFLRSNTGNLTFFLRSNTGNLTVLSFCVQTLETLLSLLILDLSNKLGGSGVLCEGRQTVLQEACDGVALRIKEDLRREIQRKVERLTH